MKKFLVAVLLAVGLISGAAVAQDRPLGNWVVDNAKILSAEQLASVQAFSQSMERDTGIRLGLVTFASTTEDPKTLAVNTINNWQMGPKSALVLVSLNPRKVYIQPGNALANSLNVDVCTAICKNTMVPFLKNGDWAGGILAGFRDIRSKAVVQAPTPAATPTPAAPRTVTKTTTTQTTTQASSGSSGPSAGSVLLVFVAIIGGIVALALLIAFIGWLFEERPRQIVYTTSSGGGGYNPSPVSGGPIAPAPAPTSTYVAPTPVYTRPAPTYSPPTYSAPYVAPAPAYVPPVVVAPPVNNGFVEGMIMNEILHSHDHGHGHSHHHDTYRDDYRRNDVSTTTTTTVVESYSDPSPPSSSYSSYDSGSSSSYDSGSSFDSGGSFDCGGGGGGGADF